MSNTYVCKSCGEPVEYTAAQDQDNQPVVKFDQHDDGVTIRIWKTVWVYDDQGRPRQIILPQPPQRVDHHCPENLNPPGVNFNQPATANPDISY